ncbi:hypothetical protein VT98_11932 [Candidatus Electrothrix communis]|uniref:Uncharacterized protein n=1 Tax=Candidatus Electrothrix communis TaxID=1859133 RepID=A0A444J487_9BACT|nr:hypothetical protein VT98_11932 [Candidatus Electrothrix communis]
MLVGNTALLSASPEGDAVDMNFLHCLFYIFQPIFLSLSIARAGKEKCNQITSHHICRKKHVDITKKYYLLIFLLVSDRKLIFIFVIFNSLQSKVNIKA